MKLTLDKSWELCLKQWRWIAKQVKAGDKRNIKQLKTVWLNENGFEKIDIDNDCFFCEYHKQHPTVKLDDCNCPAVKIDKMYTCFDPKYNKEPLKFYAKLKALNRKRNKGV